MRELVVWSGMAGVIAVLGLIAGLDLLLHRSVAAVRGLAFMLLTGCTSIVLTDLPLFLFPSLSPAMLLPVKAAAGPLSGALALTYLGVWIGAEHDDPPLRRTVWGGSLALVLASVVLVVLAFTGRGWAPRDIIALAGAVNVASVVLAMIVALRAVRLGDELARWMVVACGCLAVMVLGLYAKALGVQGLDLGTWMLTALATVGYFLIVIALTILRNREQRKLLRQARGALTEEAGLNLSQGSLLIPKVEDAIWRSHRFGRECVVAALSVRNLYQLSEQAGHGVEAQILVTLSARIRRVVGFRNVVGLYHPRCFVLVVSAVQDPRRGELLVSSLLAAVRQDMVVDAGNRKFRFSPSLGVGVVNLRGGDMDALAAMNKAEQLAMEDGQRAEDEAQQSLWLTLPPALD